MKRRIFVFIGVAIALPALAQPLSAPDSTLLPQKEKEVMLQEVVVSVQKHNQSRLEVPVAVNALSGTDLIKLDIRQFDELSEYIPGMQMQLQSPNNPGYVIRGVTSD
ncbi:MAG: hypothetical protein LBF17_03680, partial [Mediterranea sp.]|nr:hypothetical protein [Mediterranea sp.]